MGRLMLLFDDLLRCRCSGLVLVEHVWVQQQQDCSGGNGRTRTDQGWCRRRASPGLVALALQSSRTSRSWTSRRLQVLVGVQRR
jgi:hypothetical protein